MINRVHGNHATSRVTVARNVNLCAAMCEGQAGGPHLALNTAANSGRILTQLQEIFSPPIGICIEDWDAEDFEPHSFLGILKKKNSHNNHRKIVKTMTRHFSMTCGVADVQPRAAGATHTHTSTITTAIVAVAAANQQFMPETAQSSYVVISLFLALS